MPSDGEEINYTYTHQQSLVERLSKPKVIPLPSNNKKNGHKLEAQLSGEQVRAVTSRLTYNKDYKPWRYCCMCNKNGSSKNGGSSGESEASFQSKRSAIYGRNTLQICCKNRKESSVPFDKGQYSYSYCDACKYCDYVKSEPIDFFLPRLLRPRKKSVDTCVAFLNKI